MWWCCALLQPQWQLFFPENTFINRTEHTELNLTASTSSRLKVTIELKTARISAAHHSLISSDAFTYCTLAYSSAFGNYLAVTKVKKTTHILGNFSNFSQAWHNLTCIERHRFSPSRMFLSNLSYWDKPSEMYHLVFKGVLKSETHKSTK